MTVASVDLGSNSFHMTIVQVRDGQLHVVDRLREPVCLAGGLDADDLLSEESQGRAIACLERFAQRLKEVTPTHGRAVSTNTLRRAANALDVRLRFEEALGRSIDIISGQEEARLIYLGVSGSDFTESRRLVVDIGGGSTEVILGEGAKVLRAHSLFMGSVKMTAAHFSDGALDRERFRAAELEARLELRSIQSQLRDLGWERCVGASGTVAAVEHLVRQEAGSESGITLTGLKALRKTMIRAEKIRELKFEGVRGDRARVLPGGVAILIALFRSLGIESMTATSGALREGVIYDLLGRIRHEDTRDQTVEHLASRYRPDVEQGGRVETTALALLEQLPTDWVDAGSDWIDPDTARKMLTWAARLHEIGLGVAYPGFHKHGAYLVAHSDLAGFSAGDQRLLAALIRWHRRKLTVELSADIPEASREGFLRLCTMLRLAVVLNRGRIQTPTPQVSADSENETLALAFPAGWLDDHPLTAADLRREKGLLKAIGIRLAIDEVTEPVGEPPD